MKKLVIVGGGFAGSLIAKEFQEKFDTTLIDSKNYFEFTPGILRTIVEPKHFKEIQVLHKKYLPSAEILTERAIAIDSKKVKTEKKEIKFDYLIISAGSSYESPIKNHWVIPASRADSLIKSHEKLKNSKDILIIGGGIVGVELAGEILERYKNKNITIISASERLMERAPKKASEYAEKFLKSKNVKIIFNEFVKKSKNNEFVTDKKRKIRADIAFLCTGIKPNSSMMPKKFLDSNGYVSVNDFLQVNGFKNIFAAGDITSITEEKLAQNAEFHAKIIEKNILRTEKNRMLLRYVPKLRVMVISLGKHDGIILYKNFILTGRIAGFLKSIVEKSFMRKLR